MEGRTRQRASSNAGRAILLGSLVIAILATAVLAGPVVRFARGFSDPASLPARIETCGRDYLRSEGGRIWSAADPVLEGHMAVVVPGPLGYLTACPWPDRGLVPTVIFVRIDEDAYVDYSLEGGP